MNYTDLTESMEDQHGQLPGYDAWLDARHDREITAADITAADITQADIEQANAQEQAEIIAGHAEPISPYIAALEQFSNRPENNGLAALALGAIRGDLIARREMIKADAAA